MDWMLVTAIDGSAMTAPLPAPPFTTAAETMIISTSSTAAMMAPNGRYRA